MASASKPGPARTADRLIHSAQILERTARSLKDRAARLRRFGPILSSVDDLDWGKSDIQTGYYAALAALDGEGGS